MPMTDLPDRRLCSTKQIGIYVGRLEEHSVRLHLGCLVSNRRVTIIARLEVHNGLVVLMLQVVDILVKLKKGLITSLSA